VYLSMMEAAEEQAVGEVTDTTSSPRDEVVGVGEPCRAGATRKATAVITRRQRPALRGREHPYLATQIEGDAERVDHQAAHGRIA